MKTGNGQDVWLRPIPAPRPGADGSPGTDGTAFRRGDYLVQPDRRLGQIAQRRPPGVTTHQWTSATRTRFDFVLCDPGTNQPVAGVRFEDPAVRGVDADRADRMTSTVCAAIGLGLLRVESAALRPAARRIVEYVLDARAFQRAVTGHDGPYGAPFSDASLDDPSFDAASFDDEPGGPAPVGFRDILGRLPDGRTGYVNDLGAVARATAVEAYASRQLADPIVRSLHVRWAGGPTQGWAWIEVRDGGFIFERVRVWQHDFHCGVGIGRLVEDLAVAAVGERLKTLAIAEPTLYGRDRLARDLDELRRRGDELAEPFAFAHVTFD